jgi:hypothetical protein
MLAKKTSKNQVTLPRAVVRQIPDTEYFDVSVVEGAVILKPVAITVPGERLRTIRSKIQALGLTEQHVEEAVRWARKPVR